MVIENVLTYTIKTFAYTLNILCKQLRNIKFKQNRERSIVFS